MEVNRNILKNLFYILCCISLSFIVSCSGTSSQLPESVTLTVTPRNVLTDLSRLFVRVEEIELKPARNESGVERYAVYWAAGPNFKSPLLPLPIVTFPANGERHYYKFPNNAMVPPGVWGIVACSQGEGLEYCGEVSTGANASIDETGIAFNSYPILAGLNFLELFGSVFPALDDLVNSAFLGDSCPGLNIVSSCGNNVCDSEESASNCPRDCTDFSIQSYNSQYLCSETKDELTFYPNSVEEIQQILSNAVEAGQHVKAVSGSVPLEGGVRVVGKIGGATGFACTDGVVIAMDNIAHTNPNFPVYLQQFEGKEVVHAPAGMRLSALGEWLYQRGRGLGYVHMGWADVSIGGNISTSAHGSSGKNRSVLAQSIVGMDVIGADGVLRSYSEGTTDPDVFKALRTGIGYLGIIVNVKIEVQATQNLHAKVTYHDTLELFDGSPNSWHKAIGDCDWGQFMWFPNAGKWMKMCANATGRQEEAGAQNRLLNPEVPDIFSSGFEQIYQAGTCQPESDILPLLETFRFTQLVLTPPFSKLVDGKLTASQDVVGPQYIMQSAFANSTTIDVNQLDFEIAVPFTYMQQAAEYTRRFMAGENSKGKKVILPLNGIFARFGIAEDNTLMANINTGGPWVDQEPVGYFELTDYVPFGWTEEALAEYLELKVEYVAYLIQNFAGRSHWTKSQDWVFELQRESGNHNYDGRFDRFNAVVAQLDPNGVFANKMAKRFGIVYPNFTYPDTW